MSSDPEVAALKEQVAKEKATSRENLKKVMKITQEKKALEEQLAAAGGGDGGGSSADMEALRAQNAHLQHQVGVITSHFDRVQEELEGAKEEVLYWQDEAEASAAQAKLGAQAAAGSAASGGAATAELERKLAEAIAARDAEMSARKELLQANSALQASVAKLEKEKGAPRTPTPPRPGDATRPAPRAAHRACACRVLPQATWRRRSRTSPRRLRSCRAAAAAAAAARPPRSRCHPRNRRPPP